MSLTLANTNFNGDVDSNLYLVMNVGNQVMSKGIAKLHEGIADKRELANLSSTNRPLSAYTSSAPGSNTVTTTKDRRSLDMNDTMLYEDFVPSDFIPEWEQWRSSGDFTNAELSQMLLDAYLELNLNKIGTQVAELFWQGSKTGGVTGLTFVDGIITKAVADSDVVDVANIGAITKESALAILEDIWEAIPDKFQDDPDYKICVNTGDYKTIQAANQDAKKSTTGWLDNETLDMFLEKTLVHFSGIPANTIVAAKGTTGDDSNLHLGYYFSEDNENPRVDRVTNASDTWFVRINLKLDAQYVEGSEIVLYQGSGAYSPTQG